MKAADLRTQGDRAARAGAFAVAVILFAFFSVFSEAYAQPAPQGGLPEKMFVTADELVYDDVRNTASAVGNVKLYYQDATLEADRVVYDQGNGQVMAYGNVRLTQQGNVYQSDHMVLTDDFKDGFVQSLLVETSDRTRFAAARATRTGGNVIVFEKGVYTACEPCRENPAKPPLWQVKASRIIHDQGTKTIHYENARLEFFGKPIAFLPYFSHPDSTVKRKSGLLPPRYLNSTEYGFGARVPYFWNIAPNMDVTLAPAFLTEQGILGDVEFRHRTMNGAYSIRAAGIFQQTPELFKEPTQQEDFRGAISTRGNFRINEFWSWGWEGHLISDRWFLQDYDLWGANWTEAVSTIHLTGIGERNYFELRGYHFYGLSSDDEQGQLPLAGVWDYNYVHDKPVFGGELAANFNLTNTWRNDTDFEPTSFDNVSLSDGGAFRNPWNARGRNLSCSEFDTECIVRGMGGTYTRFSADASWRREFIDPVGQVWTPFAFARGDVMFRNPDNDVNLANFIDTDDEFVLRGMAGAGLEYRYPFVAQSSIGTHIIEPIAQVIFRPDEQEIGNIPNEDAQSLFFDTTTLFAWDKFSGYDRIEGGGRANVGLQYTLNLNNGAFAQLMFGQSYHLFGTNSFAERDLTDTGQNSGLDTDASDYVASAYLKVSPSLAFGSRVRLDHETLEDRSIEVETRFTTGPLSAGLIYGRYDAQPQFGFESAEGIIGSSRLNITENYYVTGAARYNIETDKFDRAKVGIGYLDECFSLGVDYGVDFHENGNEDPVHKVFVRFSLRTLAQGSSSFDVSDIIRSEEDDIVTP